MSDLDKEAIRVMVKDTFNRQIDDKIISTIEGDDTSGDDNETPDTNVNEGAEGDITDDSDVIEEMVVHAVKYGKKPEKLDVKNMRELAKLAKTGQYDSFEVETPRGRTDSVQYDVENGKLVEM